MQTDTVDRLVYLVNWEDEDQGMGALMLRFSLLKCCVWQ